jgi:hypothetical protein
MAFRSRTRDASKLFLATVHVHDGLPNRDTWVKTA